MRVPQPRPPPDAAGAASANRAGHPRGIGICRGRRDGFGDHDSGFVDGAFDAGGDDGLAGEALLVLDTDIGGEDDRRRRRNRWPADSGVLPDEPWVSTVQRQHRPRSAADFSASAAM